MTSSAFRDRDAGERVIGDIWGFGNYRPHRIGAWRSNGGIVATTPRGVFPGIRYLAIAPTPYECHPRPVDGHFPLGRCRRGRRTLANRRVDDTLDRSIDLTHWPWTCGCENLSCPRKTVQGKVR
jgi:hypothetical protein